MNDVYSDAGSYRDFRGRVYLSGDRVFRTVSPAALDDFDYVRRTGLIDNLIAAGSLVAEERVDRHILGEQFSDAACVLEHPRLPFISYPYEWSFSSLKTAALLHLDIQLEALESGVALSDASAYNIQFIGAKPIFIDNLSFCRYKQGEFWVGHREFCEQFINPLLLRSCLGLTHNSWYRGSLEGIDTGDLCDLLKLRHKLSWHVFTNVVLQARFQRRPTSSGDLVRYANEKRLPRIGFQQILHGLRTWIARMRPRPQRNTEWQNYSRENSYDSAERAAKREFISDFTQKVRPRLLWDIGCNTGDYSVVALECGAEYVVGFDFDQGALEEAVDRSGRGGLKFLPLFLDAANPTPAQGWSQSERGGLAQRGPADAVIALAVVHHLAISRRVPLEMVVGWIVSIASEGVIEFVQKSDAMIQQLLLLRDQGFDDYNQQAFEAALCRHARIVRSAKVSASGRTLYWFSRD